MSKTHVISIDAGAKNTGVHTFNFDSSKDKESFQYVITMDEKGVQTSKEGKRSQRMATKSRKRVKKAKMLVFEIINEHYSDIDINKFYTPIVNLMNRRGNTNLSLEVNESLIATLKPVDVAPYLNQFLDNMSIIDQIKALDSEGFKTLLSGINEAKKAQENLMTMLRKSDKYFKDQEKIATGKNVPKPVTVEYLEKILKYNPLEDESVLSFYGISDFYPTYFIDNPEEMKRVSELDKKFILSSKYSGSNKEAIQELLNYINQVFQEIRTGTKFRLEAFKIVTHDFYHSRKYEGLRSVLGDRAEGFLNLVFNINNLPRKPLLKYFHDISRKGKAHKLNLKNLSRVVKRYYQSFQPTDEIQKENKREILEELKSKDVISFWKSFDPKKTIPPYILMFNRNIPKCKSVILNPELLDENYPEWKEFESKIVFSNEGYMYDYDQTVISEYKTFLSNSSSYLDKDPEDYIKARRLLFFLDMSRGLGGFSPKIWKGKHPENTEEGFEILKRLGSDRLLFDSFVSFIRQFFYEKELLHKGVYLYKASKMFDICDLKPKKKKNTIEENLCNMLRISPQQLPEEISFKSLGITRSVCEKASKAQKDYGNVLNAAIQSSKQGGKDFPDITKLVASCEKEAVKLSEKFGIDPNKFRSIYQYAQLFNLLEKDINGFNKSCPHCNRDNFIRSSEFKEGIAYATRLKSEYRKTSYGMENVYYDKYSTKVVEQSKQSIKNSDTVVINIETNAFTFEEGVKGKDIQKNLDKVRKREVVEFEEKKEAILKKSSYCPMTGELLSPSTTELEHVVSRKFSRANFSTILNDSINLIPISRDGNVRKGGKILNLDNVHQNFLNSMFGTTNVKNIKKQIGELMDFIQRTNPIIRSLTKEQRNLLTGALMTSEYQSQAIRLLNHRTKSVVNGYAKCFVNKIIERVTEINPGIKISVNFISSKDISLVRRQYPMLEKYNKEISLKKQSALSHIIDALLVFLLSSKIDKNIPLEIDSLEGTHRYFDEVISQYYSAGAKNIILRRKYKSEIARPHSQPLYKKSVGKVDFLKVYVEADGKVYVGIDEESKYQTEPSILQVLNSFYRTRKGKPIYPVIPKKGCNTYKIHKKTALEFIFEFKNNIEFRSDCHREVFNTLSKLMISTIKKDIISILEKGKNWVKLFERDVVKVGSSAKYKMRRTGTVKTIQKVLDDRNIDLEKVNLKDPQEVDIIRQMFKQCFPHSKKDYKHHKVKTSCSFEVMESFSHLSRSKSLSQGYTYSMRNVEGLKTEKVTYYPKGKGGRVTASLPCYNSPNCFSLKDLETELNFKEKVKGSTFTIGSVVKDLPVPDNSHGISTADIRIINSEAPQIILKDISFEKLKQICDPRFEELRTMKSVSELGDRIKAPKMRIIDDIPGLGVVRTFLLIEETKVENGEEFVTVSYTPESFPTFLNNFFS